MSGASVNFHAEAEGEWGVGIDDSALIAQLTQSIEEIDAANPNQSHEEK